MTKICLDTTWTGKFSFETAHPNAQALMVENFYWSEIEETGPFGNVDGWNAAYDFRQWKFEKKSKSPIVYLKELIASWYCPYFNWNEINITKISDFIFSGPNISEADIQQRIQQLKEEFENSADTSKHNIDETKLRQLVLSSVEDGGTFLLEQDNAIIGTGFAQFVLEGKIDRDLKALTITAIKRQLFPVLISRYDKINREKRRQQLTKMFGAIDKAHCK